MGMTLILLTLTSVKSIWQGPPKIIEKKKTDWIWNPGLKLQLGKRISHRQNQHVIINGSESSWTVVTSGITQGSVLGLTLFLVFINDLPDVI